MNIQHLFSHKLIIKGKITGRRGGGGGGMPKKTTHTALHTWKTFKETSTDERLKYYVQQVFNTW
jgi:hypothetical protein